jgi:hypothetical protein
VTTSFLCILRVILHTEVLPVPARDDHVLSLGSRDSEKNPTTIIAYRLHANIVEDIVDGNNQF